MRVERDLAVVCVLPDDTDAARVARIAHRLHYGDWRAGGFNGHIRPSALRVFEYPLFTHLFVARLDAEGGGGSQLSCRFESVLRRAYTQNPQRPAHQREDDNREPDRPAAQHQHGVSQRHFRTLDRVQGCRQRAAPGHELFEINLSESYAARVRLEVEFLRPPAGQPVRQPVSDAVNFTVRAARRGLRDETVPAGVASAM